MNIICLDGKTYDVKYLQSKEVISTDFGTALYNFPDFVGSKLYHNSTSSDKYSLTFAIHSSQLVNFKESIKKIVTNESDAVDNPTYGKLTHIVLEHLIWGAIFGSIVGSITYGTSSEADVMCSCTFAENTPDNPIKKKDTQDENTDSVNAIDTETTDNFDVELSIQDKSALQKLADNMSSLYSTIQNSAVVSAFNDLNAELNSVILDSTRVMNAFKNVISLPGEIIPDTRNRLDLLQKQADSIIAIPATTYNLTLFNANILAYNAGISSQAAFISDSALEAAAGIKAVPLI